MGQDFKIILNKESARADTFMRVFGRLEVYVQSVLPDWANLPGFDEPQPVFMLDLDRLIPMERQILIADIQERFGIPRDEVEALMSLHGVPILARECTVLVENPQRWLL